MIKIDKFGKRKRYNFIFFVFFNILTENTGFTLLGLAWGGESPNQPKICPPRPSRLPLHQIFIPSLPKANSPIQFVLISYSFDTQVMLILILIDVQYSQNVVF